MNSMYFSQEEVLSQISTSENRREAGGKESDVNSLSLLDDQMGTYELKEAIERLEDKITEQSITLAAMKNDIAALVSSLTKNIRTLSLNSSITDDDDSLPKDKEVVDPLQQPLVQYCTYLRDGRSHSLFIPSSLELQIGAAIKMRSVVSLLLRHVYSIADIQRLTLSGKRRTADSHNNDENSDAGSLMGSSVEANKNIPGYVVNMIQAAVSVRWPILGTPGTTCYDQLLQQQRQQVRQYISICIQDVRNRYNANGTLKKTKKALASISNSTVST